MAGMSGLGYSIDVEGDGKDVRIELHVLARAYHDACLALMRCPPVGRHRLEDLGVTIEFEEPGEA
jgi:hypothetical protein